MAEKPQKDMSKKRISIVIMGMINAAVTLMLIGIWLANIIDLSVFTGNGYDLAVAIFATISLAFAAFAILNHYLTEGMFSVITSLTGYICLIMKYSNQDIMFSLFYMMIAYVVCAVIFHIREERIFEIGSIIAAIALFGMCVTDFKEGPFYLLLSLAGILVLVSGCLSLADMGPEWTRARNITVTQVSSLSYATTVTYTAGTFLTCLVFFSLGIDKSSSGLLTFKVMVATMTMFTGFYGIRNGCHKRGIDLIVISTYSLISALSGIYGLGYLPFVNIVLAIPLFTSAIQDYQNGSPVKTVCATLNALIMISEAFISTTGLFDGMLFVAKVITMYNCITTWFIYETGYAPRYMRYNKGGVTFND